MSTTLDEMFEMIEAMNVPADYRAEIIEGEIVMNQQRATRSTIIRLLTHDLEDARGKDAPILWDVRVDFPGTLNGYAPDVALATQDAKESLNGAYSYQDIELVAEVVSHSSRRDDYGVKLQTYAAALVPVYLLADPKLGYVHVHSVPRDGTYSDVGTWVFGQSFTLPVSKIPIDTSDRPRD
jgi:Uma2 family endonuclease